MNSSKYSRTSNTEPKFTHRYPHKRKELPISHFSDNILPLSQFIKEKNTSSNYISFANVKINEITKESFNSTVEHIISCLNKNEPKNDEEKNPYTISKEPIINLMKHGLAYYSTSPVINLLINIKNRQENDKVINDEYDCDELIIFYLKQICPHFEKFDDFLDTMILLTGYLTKNVIKNNTTEEESNTPTNNESEKDKDKEKEKSSKDKNI